MPKALVVALPISNVTRWQFQITAVRIAVISVAVTNRLLLDRFRGDLIAFLRSEISNRAILL